MDGKTARSLGLAVIGALALLALWASSAAADFSFCGPGEGAGQCEDPQGLATDFTSAHLYVADRGNDRIDVFDEAGVFQFAFGWGVLDGSPELQKCTTESGCLAGIAGSAAGQLDRPAWIAVDNQGASGDVYVSDSNARINHFDAEGNFKGAFGWGVDSGAEEAEICTTSSGCLKGIPGSGEATGAGECQIGGFYRPVSVGPGGNVFVAINAGVEKTGWVNKVEKFSPEGECLEETVLIEGNHQQTELAVDSEEDAYVSDEKGNGLRKYELGVDETEACKVGVGLDPAIQTNKLALDEEGHLFAFQLEGWAKGFSTFKVFTEYDPSCEQVRRFGYDKLENQLIRGLAALHTPEGDVFASKDNAMILHIASGGPGPIAIAESMEPTAIGNAQATLYGEVNPEGKATDVHLEVVDEAAYEKDIEEGGDGYEGAGVKGKEAELQFEASHDFRANDISFEAGCEVASKEAIESGECLVPETRYRWRLIATNEDDESGQGEALAEGPPFETKAPIEVTALYASGVDTTTAFANAVVNPLGIAASGHFEYVTEDQFEASGFTEAARAPATGEIDFGFGKEADRHAKALFPLQPDTAYRLRLVAISPLLEEPLHFEGTFHTYAELTSPPCPNDAFRTGPGALLPDCRAYELVSPLDKANGDVVVVVGDPAAQSQSSTDGQRLTYGSYRAFGDAASAPYSSQYLAQRDPAAGWQSHGISPPQERSIKGFLELEVEFRAFSADLCEGWIVPLFTPTLTEDAEAEHRNLYRRDDRLCGEEGYELFSRGEPENLEGQFKLEPQGDAAGGTIAAFRANDTLLGSGAPAQVPGACKETEPGPCIPHLYLQGPEGPARYVCVEPGGAKATSGCAAGTFAPTGTLGPTRSPNLQGALSGDGGRIYWTNRGTGAGKIFLRENPLGEGAECSGEGSPCSYEVSKDGEEEAGSKDSYFAAAAAEGSVAHYLTGTPSTTGALGSGAAHLFAYDAEAKESTEVAEQVFGVLGASEDASRLYFASGQVFDPEAENAYGQGPEAGEPNLYLHEAGEEPRFVAVLSGDLDVDVFPNGRQTSTLSLDPAKRNSRITPSGNQVAFMSDAQLTDFDNTAAGPGEEALNEVYLYDAALDELICASCNPAGARPEGANVGSAGNPLWAAALLPGHPTSLSQGQNLTPSGDRLYFESLDPLTPRDTNGHLDVYQWQRAEAGTCTEDSPSYSEDAAGCIDLISSGQGLRDALFLSASASGDDVFFTTLQSLVSADYGLVDAYDARVGGGFPTPPAPPPECEGEACQSPAPAPGYQPPGSSTYIGPGNLAAPKKKAKRCPKGKRKVKRKGKVRCVKKKAKRQSRVHHRRATHNRSAGPRR